MNEQANDVSSLLEAVRRRWLVALLVAIPLLVGAVAYVEQLPDSYEGIAVVAYSPQPGVDVSADTVRLLVPKYVAYLSSAATARSVGMELDLPQEQVADAVDASIAPETANLTVVVTLGDPEVAAAAANVLAREAVTLSDSDPLLQGRLIVPALEPTVAAGPPRRLIEGGAFLLALLAGLTAALVVDRSRPRVNDLLTTALVTEASGIGRLPRSRVLRGVPWAALDDPVVGTAARSMRAQLEQLLRADGLRVMAVTSSTPGEGKTTIAAVLATAFAKVDCRVLLVDADMRRPRVARLLALDEDGPGLGDVLEGGATIAEAVQQTPIKALQAIATFTHRDAGDLLTRRLQGVLERLRCDYDLVLVDCPPVLSTDDARVLAAMCDATLLVVSSGTEVSRVAEAARSLQSLDARIVGSVLNRVRRGPRDVFSGYGTYRGLD